MRSARNRQTTGLATRKPGTVLAGKHVQTVGQACHVVFEMSGPERIHQLGVGRIGTGQLEIVAHAHVEQMGLLRDDADRLWCTIRIVSVESQPRDFQRTRWDAGMPSLVIRLSTEQATLASIFWAGRDRARRPLPMMAL